MNPYWGHHFFGFFAILISRIWQGLHGQLTWEDLATDEIQILVLLLIAASSVLVGVFLVLRKMTMLANSLSHTVLLGIVITFLLVGQTQGAPDLKLLILASLITSLLTAFATTWLQRSLRLQEDASVGLVFTTLFALGIIGVTLFLRNAHLGIETIMGNVDALHLKDLLLTFYLFLFNACITLVFYQRYALMTFDLTLGRNFGMPTLWLNHLLMIQTAATAIGAFRALGAFLFLAFLVLPPLTARFFTYRLKSLIFVSYLIGAASSILAVALSRHTLSVYHTPFSTSGLTTLTLALFFFIGILYRYVLKSRLLCVLTVLFKRRHLSLRVRYRSVLSKKEQEL